MSNRSGQVAMGHNGLVLAEVGEMIVPKPHSSTNACYSTKVS